MSKGPIQHAGPITVSEELAGGLQINEVYFVQVEAFEWTDNQRDKTLSNHWRVGRCVSSKGLRSTPNPSPNQYDMYHSYTDP